MHMQQNNESHQTITNTTIASSSPSSSNLSFHTEAQTANCFSPCLRKAIFLPLVFVGISLHNISSSMVASTSFSIFNVESNFLSTTLGFGDQEAPNRVLSDDDVLLQIYNPNIEKNTAVVNDYAIQACTTSLSPCRIMIYSKTFDGHYEVFESIARKYPLPFSSTTKCQNAGLTPENPIVVDFVMPFQWQGGYKEDPNGSATKKENKKGEKKAGGAKKKSSKQSEGWGWTTYFQQHLQNSTAQRIDKSENDGGRYICYAGVLGLDKRSFQSISWNFYSFMIEASCDMWGNQSWKDWLAKDKKRHYCVFHRKHEKSKLAKNTEKRTCYLNPQFGELGHCWFLPTVYPKFSKPLAPFTEANPKLHICIGWKSMGKGANNLRDDSLLVRALSNIQNSMPNNDTDIRDKLQVLVIGRNARVPEAFVLAKMVHMVQVHNNVVAFYEYQELIATNCHALIPLVHPEQTEYFLTATDSPESTTKHSGQGRLSGIISQVIGNRIPSLVHSAVADIYQQEFTAPYFVYNSTQDGGKAFQFALEGLIDYYFSNRSHSR